MNDRSGLFLILVLMLAAGMPTVARASDSERTSEMAALVEAHNRERAKAGLPPLSANPKLEAAALAHSRDMAEHDKMTHEGSDGSTPEPAHRAAGLPLPGTAENVAEGYRDVEEAMNGWMNSPHHKANILGDFTEMGAAQVVSDDGKPYWCANFGRPWPKIDPDRAAAGTRRGHQPGPDEGREVPLDGQPEARSGRAAARPRHGVPRRVSPRRTTTG